ncbi:6-phosphogluconolactonase [Sulfurimonas sp.]|uniref:6-phosphogluconolactonase n=1 Tax=Sulfurimonas sp. TaxID=2022749 RepID=UPI0039E22883
MKNNYKFYNFKNSNILVEELSIRIAADLKKAIELKQYAVLAVSGGSTPKELFQKLSHMDLPWHKVTVTLVDERWVETYSNDSNEKLIRDTLLQNRASFAKFIPLKNAIVKNIDGVLVTKNRFNKMDELDVVLLGMGSDGHTASFFPDTEELDDVLQTKDKCYPTTANVEPYQRMTLTRSFLLTAKSLILHIEGGVKKTAFDIAAKSYDHHKMPIIAMMQQESPILEVYHA